MKYQTYSPSVSLSSVVRYFWVLEGVASESQPYFHRTMADGSAELVFHYRGVFREMENEQIRDSFSSGISGPSRRYHRYSITEPFGIFGVYLYPFAIPALFGMPASVLSNNNPDLYTFLGREGHNLEERIYCAEDGNHRMNILIDYFLRQLNKSRVDERSFRPVKELIHSGSIFPVSELARRYFISERQFERNFKQHAGFSPKLYMRIIRFQSAISHFGAAFNTLTKLAYQCGYFDQSHFIHDFREFSGFHPAKYFAGNNDATAWKEV